MGAHPNVGDNTSAWKKTLLNCYIYTYDPYKTFPEKSYKTAFVLYYFTLLLNTSEKKIIIITIFQVLEEQYFKLVKNVNILKGSYFL